MTPHPDIYPKRVIWMQEEDTLKWVLVGLSSDGEVQDPRDYEDVSYRDMLFDSTIQLYHVFCSHCL